LSLRRRVFAVVIPLATAALFFVPGHGYGGEHAAGFAADGEAIQFDVFGIASSRTMFLPAPPAGKVTVQLLATAVNAGIPGDFRFYFAAPASVASSASTSVMTS